jgi:hypothetical protein
MPTLADLLGSPNLRLLLPGYVRSEGARMAVQVTAADMRVALTRVRPSALREMALQLPQVCWTDIGGYDSVKLRLQEAVRSQLQMPANPHTLSLGVRLDISRPSVLNFSVGHMV